jgi:hypothetical protein
MGYSFKNDIDENDCSSWLLFYQLRDVFRLANPANPEQTFKSMQQVLGTMNVVDEDQHENSPWRYRPASLDNPKYQLNRPSTPLPSKRPLDAPARDWAKLSR